MNLNSLLHSFLAIQFHSDSDRLAGTQHKLIGRWIKALCFRFERILAGIQASDAKREFRFSEYLGFTLVLTVLGLLLIGGSTWSGGYGSQTALVILAVALGKAFDVISDVFFGLYQLNEHMDRIAKPLMVNGFLSVAALGGVVYLTGSVVWGAVGWAVAKGTRAELVPLPRGVHGVEHLADGVADDVLRQLRAVLGPVGLHHAQLRLVERQREAALLPERLQLRPQHAVHVQGLVGILAGIGGSLVHGHLGERDLGFFATMAYLMVPGNMVLVAALGQAVTPRLAKYFAAGQTGEFVLLLLRMAGLVALGAALAVLAILIGGKLILTLLYGAEYTQHLDVLFWVTIEAGLGFICSVLAYAMTAARRFRAQAPLSAITVVISIAACAILISRYGLPGAAYGMVIATSFQLIGSIGIVMLALRGQRSEIRGRKSEIRSQSLEPVAELTLGGTP